VKKVDDIAEARKKREKQKADEEYKQALQRVLERANKTDW
jgi:hypothetical protein